MLRSRRSMAGYFSIRRHVDFCFSMNRYFPRFLSMLVLLGLMISCIGEEKPDGTKLYFPPSNGDSWERLDPTSLGFETAKLDAFYTFLSNNDTRAFILLKDGKIVLEKYFGTDGRPYDQNNNWYWASAGKTLMAYLIGHAQDAGHFNIQQTSADFLGYGWSSLSPSQEKNIKIWHHMTMTTGLDDRIADRDDPRPSSLVYLSEPGTRWAYHNAPYTLLEKILELGTGKSLNLYTQEYLLSKTGMKGLWVKSGFNSVFFSDARSMARFGLLLLAEGEWQGKVLLKDKDFLRQMKSSSQSLNESYGYLTWLNGQGSFMVPELQQKFQGTLFKQAPSDMYAALGRDGQFLCVVPSKGLVLVRMGGSPDQASVPFLFLDEIWKELTKIMVFK